MFEVAERFPPPRVHVFGIRLGESTRRFRLFGKYAERDESLWFYCNEYRNYCAYYFAPILQWTREDVLRYIEEKGIPPNPLWSGRHSSHDCAICICYANFRDWLILKQEHPELWRRIYSAYRELNQKYKIKKEKVLAWNWVDLDDVARTPSLTDFARQPQDQVSACEDPR